MRIAKGGRRLDLSIVDPRRSRIKTGTVIGAAKIARDITARFQAEGQLIATTAKFESVFNQSGIFAGTMPTGTTVRFRLPVTARAPS